MSEWQPIETAPKREGMSHTHGRICWSAHADRPLDITLFADPASRTNAIAEIICASSAQGAANARRLVACWNACEGQSTESLEAGYTQGYSPWAHVAELELQRDELLEALRSCEPPHPACGETVGNCVRAGKCGCSLGAAINKAEGKS